MKIYRDNHQSYKENSMNIDDIKTISVIGAGNMGHQIRPSLRHQRV